MVYRIPFRIPFPQSTASGNADLTASETWTGTDGASVAVAVAGAETWGGADSSSASAAVTALEGAPGTDAALLSVAAFLASESGLGTDSATGGPALVAVNRPCATLTYRPKPSGTLAGLGKPSATMTKVGC
jgi:hypothetical protein